MFRTSSDVFTSDGIDTWIAYKGTREIDPIRPRPCPSVFHLLLRYLTTRRVNREYRHIGAKLSCPRRCTL